MENELLTSAPGYSVCEYLLILQPHEELWNTIIQEKKTFAEKFDCPTATYLKPHIALVHFKQYEMMEHHIVRRLKNITMALSPFKVELKGFGSFPSHTIYINVTSKVQIMNTVKELRDVQKLMKLDKDNKPHFITEPHIALARKLLPWQYEKAWLEYEHKHFNGRFMADHALLLKRKEGHKGWKTSDIFAFENRQYQIKQGLLFQ